MARPASAALLVSVEALLPDYSTLSVLWLNVSCGVVPVQFSGQQCLLALSSL